MNNTTEPTREELIDDSLKSVYRDADDTWRHGCYITQVFHRASDETYWRVEYNLSTDGEVNGLYDDTYDICRVYPHKVTTTVYEKEPTQ